MTDNESNSDATNDGRATKTNGLTYAIDDDESPSEAVVKAVSALTGRDVLDLDPLYHIIDPDHVDGVFENLDSDAGKTEIAFEFNGCHVSVTHEEVAVEETPETS